MAIQTWLFAKQQEPEDREQEKEAIELNNKAYYIATHAKDNRQGAHVLGGIQRNMMVMRLSEETSEDKL